MVKKLTAVWQASDGSIHETEELALAAEEKFKEASIKAGAIDRVFDFLGMTSVYHKAITEEGVFWDTYESRLHIPTHDFDGRRALAKHIVERLYITGYKIVRSE